MKYDFNNKSVIVTGSASGIGLDVARRFAFSGASVLMSDINEKDLKKEADNLKNEGYNVSFKKCDVSDEDDVNAMVDKAIEEFGKIDIAYNNAGVQAPVSELADADGGEFDRVVAINLRGIWSCMKYELLQMRKQEQGVIVNCSSLCGIVAMPGLGAYTATKHGVIGLTKSAALDYASRNIRINAICPGTTDTPMVSKAIEESPETMAESIGQIPMQRIADVGEISDAVLWLCSEGAGFMTGQAIVPDGGYSIQ